MSQIVLNKQQIKAVTHIKGPLLIVAGAGTGKTTVITEHIKYLIYKKSVSPGNIFAATFTDKSASEILERLDKVMPLGYEEPWLGTFHSLCDRILRNEALEIGLDPAYKIITPIEQWILIKKHLFDFKLKYYLPLGNPSKFISALIKFFSRIQDEDSDTASLYKLAEIKKSKAHSKSDKEKATKLFELAKAFQTYQQIKAEASVLDFGDLIKYTLLLFRDRKSILERYQTLFQHILVDEFQDTNYAQYQLMKLLAPANKNPNLFVVGDDDQAIFKFRGASVSNILQFKKDYTQAQSVVLLENYRSLSPILDSSYNLIQNNNPDRLEKKLKINKKLKPKRKEKLPPPQIVNLLTEQKEIDFTLEKITDLISENNYTYQDFAILARANSHLEPFVSGLKRAGIPYQLIGNRGLFDQEEVKDLLIFLKVVLNPEDTPSLFHLLHLAEFKIKTGTIINLLNQAKVKQKSLWQILKANTERSIKMLVKTVEEFQTESLKGSVSKLLYNFIYKFDFVKNLTLEETVENELKIRNINLLFEKIKQFEIDNNNTNLANFIEVLDLWQAAGDNPAQAVIEDVDTLSLLTIHSAKGLEFPVVFIPCLIAGRFPSTNRRDLIEFPQALIKETLPQGNENLQEERRLLYVAMTRARDYLFLTYADDYGGLRTRKPSGFLKETNLSTFRQEKDLSHSLPFKPLPTPQARYLSPKISFSIKSLSYSQIDTFLACPLKYKYRYLLKVPAEPHPALSFGATIHKTLHQFHRSEQQGKVPSLPQLLLLYKKNFIDLGYDSPTHKNKRFRAGVIALRKYYKSFPKLFGKPKMLESAFKLNLNGLPFIGKIDRIDLIGDQYEIIDYKTGELKDQKSVDKDEQLTIYALAAREIYKLKIENMSLYFIEKNIKVTTNRSDKQLLKQKARLIKTAEKIKSSSFSPNSGYPFPCGYCEYNKICPFAKSK